MGGFAVTPLVRAAVIPLIVATGVLSSSACFLFKDSLEEFVHVDQGARDSGIDEGTTPDVVDAGDVDRSVCVHGTSVCAGQDRVQLCNQGQWATPSPCGQDQTCLEGECVSSWFGVECPDSDACRDGLTCWFGRCQEEVLVEEGGECHVLSECEPGLHCDSRTCLPNGPPCVEGRDCTDLEKPICSPLGFCQAGTAGEPCTGGGDCAQNEGFQCTSRTQTEGDVTRTIETCENRLSGAGCDSEEDCAAEEGFIFCVGYSCQNGEGSALCGSEEHCADTGDPDFEPMICVRNRCWGGRDGSPCYPEDTRNGGDDHCQNDFFCVPACDGTGTCNTYQCQAGLRDSRCLDADDCRGNRYCLPQMLGGTCVDGQAGDWCDTESDGQCAVESPHCTGQGCAAGEISSYCDDDQHCNDGLRCVITDEHHECYDGSRYAPCAEDDPTDCLEDYPHCTYAGCESGDHGSSCDDNEDCNEDFYCVDPPIYGALCVDGRRGDRCNSRDDCVEELRCVDHWCAP